MYKIAILGCENSHANNFLRLISEGAYPDIEVVGVYSNEPEAAKKLADTFGAKILDNYDSAVGSVDGVMITARHGDNHMKYALPYIESGIPMFIDKPITCYEDEAIEFMRIARERGIRLCGGSTCVALAETLELAGDAREGTLGEVIGGNVVAPLQSGSVYGGFYFYAEHLVDIMLTIFGTGVRSVYADKSVTSTALVFSYDSFNVTATYTENGGYYSAAVFGTKGQKMLPLTFTPASFKNEMDGMKALLDGGKMEKSYEDFILPVFVMNAILRSYESGKKEEINKIEL